MHELKMLVEKSSGNFWLVIVYRGLNAATISQNLTVPHVDEVFDTIGENQPRFFTVLDCTMGFIRCHMRTILQIKRS